MATEYGPGRLSLEERTKLAATLAAHFIVADDNDHLSATYESAVTKALRLVEEAERQAHLRHKSLTEKPA